MFVDEPEKMQKILIEALRVLKKGGRLMGDISTPEREVKELEDEKERSKDEPNQKTIEWIQKRIEGSIELEKFLNTLSSEEYSVEVRDVPISSVIARVVEIKK